MSPRNFAHNVGEKLIKDAGDEATNALWFALFRISVYMFPILVPMIVAVNAWLISETFINRDFRNRGTRLTREEYIEDRSERDAEMDSMRKKYESIHELLVRVDETTKSLKEELSRQREHSRNVSTPK